MQTKTDLLSIPVSHYSGCGNDFLLVDNRNGQIPELSRDCISSLCSKAGVDGFIMALHSKSVDVAMKYYNCDGTEAEMCGNGVRCLTQFLRQKRDFSPTKWLLETALRDLEIRCDGKDVSVNMGPVHDYGWDIALEHEGKTYLAHHLNTGVPHVVIFVDDLDALDVENVGRYFRFHERFQPQGANINFVKVLENNKAQIRTYERGVERETLACGTGVTAAGRCLQKLHNFSSPITIKVQSGESLQVLFSVNDGNIDNVILKGPATWIRDGIIEFDPQSQDATLHL